MAFFDMEVTKDSTAGMADSFQEELAQSDISKKSLVLQADKLLTVLQSIGSKALVPWAPAIAK